MYSTAKRETIRYCTKVIFEICREVYPILLEPFTYTFFFYFAYLSSIHEKAMYRYVLDGMSALAWELPFPGHLSFT